MPLLKKIGMVARWKPVHKGHAAVLQSLVEAAEQVYIGIGSSNKHDVDNPFTSRETADMIRLVLPGRFNYAVMDVPDIGHGPRWRDQLVSLFGPLDVFVTANPYVRDLLKDVYPIVHPIELVRADEHFPIEGTMVRRAMSWGLPWKHMVPDEVASYLERRGLVERFLREFAA